jgi:hypothetical protein
MRKIEKQMIAALENNSVWKSGNTSVCGNAVSLHGNHIATMRNGRCEVNRETLARWPSNTTKSRLRALGANVTTKAHVTYLDGVAV